MGRAAEVERLSALVTMARQGSAQFCLLTGCAGTYARTPRQNRGCLPLFGPRPAGITTWQQQDARAHVRTRISDVFIPYRCVLVCAEARALWYGTSSRGCARRPTLTAQPGRAAPRSLRPAPPPAAVPELVAPLVSPAALSCCFCRFAHHVGLILQNLANKESASRCRLFLSRWGLALCWQWERGAGTGFARFFWPMLILDSWIAWNVHRLHRLRGCWWRSPAKRCTTARRSTPSSSGWGDSCPVARCRPRPPRHAGLPSTHRRGEGGVGALS